MREIILDTETTGLDPLRGDRLVEIGCIELVNHFPSGQTYHVQINPERDMPEEAFRVHGLSGEMLATKPVFERVVEEFLAFIGDARLVIHNASFDMGFINAELKRSGREPIPMDRVVDTLAMARRRFPAASNSLDALCNRFGIDKSKRTVHGALVDAELLADIYIELIGGRQASFGLSDARRASQQRGGVSVRVRERPQALAPRLTEADIAEHAAFIAQMGDKAIWYDTLPRPEPQG
ncbi:DNA polymerase III subunit epsilon [Phreatobacter aquaticus]|uniref:DNA polymerase III subunit epsilon n=1 Tax=Phreatobacter aquaticus TaxID=2570229 RepID=A0A4D7QB57_9HYPH|nr:DNA polymerase III subunit epsilon [Phreatobacter aquaticus]QCK85290.1 DNA polymerase III subunit epsilon [Phreatobacter aquaticus]